MEIFSDNIDSIQKELDLIKDTFGMTSHKRLTDSFEILEGFYQIMYEVSGKEDVETVEILLKNKKYRQLRLEERKLLYKKNIQNFIIDKNKHHAFAGKVLDLYNREYKYYMPKKLYLRDPYMAEILCDFLNDEFNQADKFIELAENKRIFKIDMEENEEETAIGTAGYTMYDYINKNSFVVISDDKEICDVNMMRVLAHEFGHVSDNFERDNASRKQNASYYWLSTYAEVYSMLYEKLFYDYLIKNNIFKENASVGLKNYYLDIKENFNSVEYLSSLDDYLLINERYKKKKNIADQIQVDEDGSMYIASAVLDNFNETKLYSYGGLLANYFAYLKHNDIDLFNKNFNKFKQRRFNLFDFKIFEDIGTNEDEIISIYDKGLDEITNTKKLILK